MIKLRRMAGLYRGFVADSGSTEDFARARRCASQVVLCFLLFLVADGRYSHAQGDVSRTALEAIAIGHVARLKDLIPASVEIVCVLQPYQDALRTDSAAARRANKHLQAIKFSADEGHWALVLIGNADVNVQRLSRSRRLDVAAGHEGTPSTFRPTECASVSSGGFRKFEVSNRPMLVLGELQ
ncbi:MAG: hypothetical protein ACKOEC_20830 [Acidimicrobiia bacterium]